MTYGELPPLAFSILSDSSSSTLTGVRNNHHSNNKMKNMLLAKFLSSSGPSCPRKESGSMFACHLGCPAPRSLSLLLRPTKRLRARGLASFEWRHMWIREVFSSKHWSWPPAHSKNINVQKPSGNVADGSRPQGDLGPHELLPRAYLLWTMTNLAEDQGN